MIFASRELHIGAHSRLAAVAQGGRLARSGKEGAPDVSLTNHQLRCNLVRKADGDDDSTNYSVY